MEYNCSLNQQNILNLRMSRVFSNPQYSKSKNLLITQAPQLYTQPVSQYIPQQSQYLQSHINYPHPQMQAQTVLVNRVPRNSNIQPSNMYLDNSQLKGSGISIAETDFLIYCPVCKVDYFNSQVNSHMRRHYVGDSYNFLNQEQVQTVQSSLPYDQVVSYPLVQPLEFYTNQLDVPQAEFIIDDNQDDMESIERHQVEIQTTQKPPLQAAKQKTNLYNCLDNMVNDDSFTINDVFKHNQGLASKRELTEWEYLVLGNKN